jgi:hypothetical protein
MTATALTLITIALTYASGAGACIAALAAVATIVALLLPVLAATVVLAWHTLKGTDPGPAADHLLTLVRILWGAMPTRTRK